MGLPQVQPADASAPEGSSYITTPAAAPSSSTGTQLPPEAVELAGRLFDFARQGATSSLDQYLNAGIPINLTNHKGDTLLMLAAYHGHPETVRMLLDRGADVNVLNERGQSPVAGAVFKGYDEIVLAMRDKGADLYAGHPNAVDTARMFRRAELLRAFGVEA